MYIKFKFLKKFTQYFSTIEMRSINYRLIFCLYTLIAREIYKQFIHKYSS